MKISTFVLVVTLLVHVCRNDALRILGIFPYAGKSHFLNFEPVLQELAARGHNVTVITHYPQTRPLPRYRDISLHGASNMTTDVFNLDELFAVPVRLIQYGMIVKLATLSQMTCSYLETPTMQRFIHSTNEEDSKFDVVLIEQFDSDCYLGLVHRLKVPWIGMTSHIPMPFTYARYGGGDPPAVVSNHFMPFEDRMSFIDRVENSIMYVFTRLMHRRLVREREDEMVRKVFGSDVPPLDVLAESSSLLLASTHFALNRPRSFAPNVIEIGGVHVKDRPIRIPKNIEKWINESEHGVIYFSMGSMIKGHTFPVEKRQAFLRAFGRLKQRVLWKWEADTMPDQPSNVMIQSWMPQFDILCHPNVKAFIAHAGLLGITEAVHCGVPVVAMPQFGDQFSNAAALQASGGGVVLSFREATEESIHAALSIILQPEFNKQAKELSERFRDRPMSALDTAVYWIEYVARHKGAPHMRSAAVGMPLYQYLLLDVIAFILAIALIILFIIIKSLKCILRKLFVDTSDIKKKTN